MYQYIYKQAYGVSSEYSLRFHRQYVPWTMDDGRTRTERRKLYTQRHISYAGSIIKNLVILNDKTTDLFCTVCAAIHHMYHRRRRGDVPLLGRCIQYSCNTLRKCYNVYNVNPVFTCIILLEKTQNYKIQQLYYFHTVNLKNAK